MSTYVYGGRDFKGNIVSNAAMPSVAGDPSSWPAPVQDGNYGHVQWSTVNGKPYWWDTNTNLWTSFNSGPENDPWVFYWYLGTQTFDPTSVPPIQTLGDGRQQSKITIADATTGALLLNHSHDVLVPLGGVTFNFSPSGGGDTYIFESSFAGKLSGGTVSLFNHIYGGLPSTTTIEGISVPTFPTVIYEDGAGIALLPDSAGTLITSDLVINGDFSIDLVTTTVAAWDAHYITFGFTIMGQVPA